MDAHTPIDVADAVLVQLRDSPCAALFGDTWAEGQVSPGVMKFGTDYIGDSAAPWLVAEEIGERYEFMTAGAGDFRPYIATGQMAISIFATDRSQARMLGVQVAAYLDDPAMSWSGFPNLMSFRLASAAFVPRKETGPQSPTIFQRTLVFEFQYQGFLGLFS